MSLPSFSAALLAGGKSTRMGRDKALLPLPNSELLWQNQFRTLQELQPTEIFWSGPSRPGLPDIRLIPDVIPSAGPLAGVSACLDATCTDLLFVLAIDLPQMTSTFLRNLLDHCSIGKGAVVRHWDFFEPLAAIYPRELSVLAASHLAQGRHAMQDLIREAIKQGLLQIVPLEKENVTLFKNWNTPPDLAESTHD